jgi:hypothetical protein
MSRATEVSLLQESAATPAQPDRLPSAILP